MPDDSPSLTPEALARLLGPQLITEWSKTDWRSGDPVSDVLPAEFERKGLGL